MAALAASVSSWIPEDDLLLKNAVEAGASLEALAKGAVRFSRKFTIGELRDRWHSLLYDPSISAEASVHMAEFELSASNNQSKSFRSGASVGNSAAPPKRKVESVRRLYYALRKRTCIRPLNSPNLKILGSPNMSDGMRDGTACQEHVRLHHETPVGSSILGNCIQNHFEFKEMDIDFFHHRPQDNNLIKESTEHAIYEQKNVHEESAHILGETLVDFENCPGVEEMGPSNALPESDAPFHSLGYSSPQSRTPLWKTIEDIPAPAMPVNVSHGEEVQRSEETFILPDDLNEKKPSLCNPEIDLVDLSDSLLNLGNEEELHFIETDEKDSINKSCHDNVNQRVLSSPNDVHRDDVPDVKEPHACLAIPDDSNPAELEVIAEQSHSGHGNQYGIFCSDVNVPSSTSMPKPQSHDLLDGEICCTLNTEDTEIPCNDDFLPGKVVSLATSYKVVCDPALSFDPCKDNEQKLRNMNKEDSPAQCFTASHTRGSDMFPGTSQDHQLFGSGVKSKSTDVNCHASISGQANNAHAGLIQSRTALAAQKSLTNDGLKERLLRTSCATDVPLHTTTTNAFSQPEANSSTLDQEALLDQEEYESDDDIPYFSDIESMILDLELCPEDLNTCFSTEVSRYQHDDTKRTIIRLEQAARSSMQRSIAYQGALALFYGRHLKYYIKETEVILGRATEDFDVDIDLGREGCANKISRRQALIKMEGDGSFILRNLGKSSIFLNGREIATGQGMNLSSSSLIEIRKMAFMFEINHETVRRYLANTTRRNQEKNANFEWSEERVPL